MLLLLLSLKKMLTGFMCTSVLRYLLSSWTPHPVLPPDATDGWEYSIWRRRRPQLEGATRLKRPVGKQSTRTGRCLLGMSLLSLASVALLCAVLCIG